LAENSAVAASIAVATAKRVETALAADIERCIAHVRECAPPSIVVNDPEILTQERKQMLIARSPKKPELMSVQGKLSSVIAKAEILLQHAYNIPADLVKDAKDMKSFAKQCLGTDYVLTTVLASAPNDDIAARTLARETVRVLKKKGCGVSWALPDALANLLHRVSD
jgi:hypothetical protein